MNKSQRQSAIKEIIYHHSVGNQEELSALLKKRGFDVTQATLSRDLADLGVARTHSEQGTRYMLNVATEEKQLQSVIGMEILDIEANETTIVIRTLPGRAPGVASFLDAQKHPMILGTVAGDDTILVTPASIKRIHGTIKAIKQLMQGIRIT